LKKKCEFKDGVSIKPDGINELDPCVYETIGFYTNVNVEIIKCKYCGNIDIRWYRTENTEQIDIEDLE
jgi:hypothetical protein